MFQKLLLHARVVRLQIERAALSLLLLVGVPGKRALSWYAQQAFVDSVLRMRCLAKNTTVREVEEVLRYAGNSEENAQASLSLAFGRLDAASIKRYQESLVDV